jgi:hypothetical protein
MPFRIGSRVVRGGRLLRFEGGKAMAGNRIKRILEDHAAYTVIRNADDGSTAGYECKCGVKDTPDAELWGRSWLVNHQTNEIVKVL